MCIVHLVIYEGVVPPVVAPGIPGVPCRARRPAFPNPSVPLPAPLVFIAGMVFVGRRLHGAQLMSLVLAITCPHHVLESWPSFKAPFRGHLMASHHRVAHPDSKPSVLGRC